MDVFGTSPCRQAAIVAVSTWRHVLWTVRLSFILELGGWCGYGTGQYRPWPADCFFAANMNTPPDICIVSPGLGAFIISPGTSVLAYPDIDVGTPDSVVFHQSFFVFTYGSGTTRTSDPNSTNINALNFATAESKPDTLYRPLPLGNGQLLLAGSSTIEVWDGLNTTGYPFNYVATIPRGIHNAYAIAGNEDGWGKGIFFIGDDNKVSTLTTYTPTPISIPDLDDLIETEPDKTKLTVGVYVSGGHGFVVVQGIAWCWVYDTTLQTWHERQSYLGLLAGTLAYWRSGCGYAAIVTAQHCAGFPALYKELGNPLAMRIETGPFGAFPKPVRINGIEVYMTKGKSDAPVTIPMKPTPGSAFQSRGMAAIPGQSLAMSPLAGKPSLIFVPGRQSGDRPKYRACAGGLTKVPGCRLASWAPTCRQPHCNDHYDPRPDHQDGY